MDNSLPNSYRLASFEEPSVEMLSSIMTEATDKANLKWENTQENYFNDLFLQAKEVSTLKREFHDGKTSSSKGPFLTVIAGPNGSGKTTFTSQMLEHQWLQGSEYINPDNVAQQMFGDWNSPEAILKAARHCVEKREDCLSRNKNLVIETVLSTYRNVDFIQRAISEGYFVRLFFIATRDPRINAARVARRVMEGGHDVPISKIISRYPKSILNCLRLSNLVDSLYVYDNSVDGVAPRLLLRKEKGELISSVGISEMPRWAKVIL